MTGLPIKSDKLDTRAARIYETHYIPSLDGIRALSFGFVFLAHTWVPQLGVFGVSVFFFLSGFLITTLLRIEQKRDSTISIRRFYLRRVLRIFPPLYLTILVIGVLAALHITQGTFSAGQFLAASTFGANYYAIFKGFSITGLHPLWSLAVEEHFYLFFPLVFLLLAKAQIPYKKQALLLCGICVAVLAWRLYLVLHGPLISQQRILWGTDTRLDTILFGCILALGANPVLDRNITSPWFLTLGAVILLLLSWGVRNEMFHLSFRFTLQGIAFMPLFIIAISRASDWAKWLNYEWIRLVGKLSYSLYLIHGAMLGAVSWISSHDFGIFVALAASVLYSWTMYVIVEQPLGAIRKRLDYDARGFR